nr:VCBS repeat-containing protein [Deltaproteobacteria bacterium]
MRRLSFVVSAIVIAGAACTSFDAIERGVCGNGLLEPGEDCDSSEASCVACAVTCTSATADCPSSSYTCGVDGLCHAPAGTLGAPSVPSAFPIDEMRVTDIDGDGIGDVLGVSKTSLVVRHGDPSGTLSDIEQTLTPIQGGVSSFSYIDADATLDVAFGTADGVVVYTSPFGKLSPLADRTPIEAPGTRLESLFSIDPYYFGIIAAHEDTKRLELVIGAIFDPGKPLGTTGLATPFCTGMLTSDAFAPGRVDVFRATDSLLVVDFLVVLTGGSPSGPRTCVTAVHIDLLQAVPANRVKFYEITPAPLPASRLAFAHLGPAGDPCPHLVGTAQLDTATPKVVAWAGSMVGAGETAHCTLATTPAVLGFDDPPTPTATMIGRAELDPPLAFVASDAIVLSDGVYAASGTTLYRLYSTTRPIRRIGSGDFDGNGTQDLVATTDGEDDLDILYRTGSSFQQYRVDTASRVTSTTVGDFDGNGVADVAYVEPVEGHQRMMITYGTRDRLLEPIEVSSFREVLAVGVVGIPGSLDQLNSIDDLVVVDQPESGVTVTTVLRGSSQRTMLSYFDPRVSSMVSGATTIVTRAQSTLDGVAIGRFGNENQQTAVAIGHASQLERTNQPTQNVDEVRAWPMSVTPEGLVPVPTSSGHGFRITNFTACDIDSAPMADLCFPATQYVVWPLVDHDVVVAVDRQAAPNAGVITPMTASTTIVDVVTAMVPAEAFVRSLHVVDLDGDGTSELLATFGPSAERGATSAGLVELCAVDGAGIPTSCENVGAAIPGAPTCVDAAPGRFEPAGPTSPVSGNSIVVLCYQSREDADLYRVTKDAAGFH